MGVNSFRDAKQRLIEQVEKIKAQCDGLNPLSYQGVNDSFAKILGIKVEEKKLDFEYEVTEITPREQQYYSLIQDSIEKKVQGELISQIGRAHV